MLQVQRPGSSKQHRTESSAFKDIGELATFVVRNQPLLVLTGAGCSTASGIPDYRDEIGEWKHPRPVMFQDFVADPAVRRRYWARSVLGWQRISSAGPNGAHRGIAELESLGYVRSVVTQNVDGLHQQAGSQHVTDLHGRLDAVVCLTCTHRFRRDWLQSELQRLNPAWNPPSRNAPDGDADLGEADASSFAVPDCPACPDGQGILKPEVVFFGESVPRSRVREVESQLTRASGVLVVGTSLMAFSGFRFARDAAATGTPLAAVNIGATRADPLLQLKVRGDCAIVLEWLAASLPTAR